MKAKKRFHRTWLILEWSSYFLLLTALIIFGYTFFSNAEPPSIGDISVGDRVQFMEAVSGREQGEKLLVVLSPHCSYCRASMPFYKVLIEQRQRPLSIVVAIDTSLSVSLQRRLLELSEVVADTIIAIPTTQEGIPFVPTIIHLDRRSVVQQIWIGQLNEEQEGEVLAVAR